MKDLRKDLLLLGVVIALLIPAAAAETYITMTVDDTIDYKGLHVATIDALDPLDAEITLVTLDDGDNLTVIPRPAFGVIIRIFEPASGAYHGGHVTVMENKTIAGGTLPGDYRIYTDRTFPNFTVKVPDQRGNVLLVKLPESSANEVDFTTFFEAAEEQGYLFTDNAILYSNSTGISAYGGLDTRNYNMSDLNFTLARNEVDLSDFSPDGEMVHAMMKVWPYTRPEAGEYLLTAMEYDCATGTLNILAAMPILILDGNIPAAWDGDDPYYQDRGAGAAVSFGERVNRTACILLRDDTIYDLTMRVDTREFASRPIPTSMPDLISILQAAADEAGPITYILTPNGTPAGAYADSGPVIAGGYGISRYADAPEVEIEADALAALNPGTYSLYALGMAGEEIVAVDYREVEVRATSP